MNYSSFPGFGDESTWGAVRGTNDPRYSPEISTYSFELDQFHDYDNCFVVIEICDGEFSRVIEVVTEFGNFIEHFEKDDIAMIKKIYDTCYSHSVKQSSGEDF